MSYTPLVSIITIVYNGEKHLEQAIRSVVEQTYSNIEYIIVDGGSTDNSISIIKKYESRISNWISEKDNGISDAFNKGLRKATGEIIGIINADDWYEKDAVARVVENIGEYDIAYGDLQLYKEDKKDFILLGNAEQLTDVMTVNHPTVFVKKAVYDGYGLFDESLRCAMDYDLMLRFKVNNCRFKYIPKVLANMRWAGTSDNNWLQGCKETLSIKNKYLPNRKIHNSLFFLKHVLGISIPRFLEKAHLSFFVKAYRKRFSAQEKTYNQ
jgi:glycosyltransferase involved in cell wall biosynthesis